MIQNFTSTADTVEGVYQDLGDHMLRTLVQKGMAPPSLGVTKSPSDAPIRSATDLLSNVQKWTAMQREVQGGSALDPNDAPVENTYRTRRFDFISREEGMREFAYDDATGKRVTDPSQKSGLIHVGVGFNMEKPGAREIFSKALPGVDFDAVFHGRQAINTAQANRLFDYEAQEAEKIVAQKFKGVDLQEHQRLALVSLAFNSPALIGPKLTAAVRSGNWKSATDEILFNSNRTGNRGLAGRRHREASLFAGPSIAASVLPSFKDYLTNQS